MLVVKAVVDVSAISSSADDRNESEQGAEGLVED